MTPKGSRNHPSRTAPLLAILLFLLPSLLAGTAQAHHQTRADFEEQNNAGDAVSKYVTLPPTIYNALRNVNTGALSDVFDTEVPTEDQAIDALPETTPLVDQVRDETIARMRQAYRDLQGDLARRNMSPASIAPGPTRVLEDHVDPGRRIGGVGDWRVAGVGNGEWRAAPGVGSNGSAAYTMTDPQTGRYGSMDTLLVSPAIDLSAYLVDTGRYPFVSGDFEDTLGVRLCDNGRSYALTPGPSLGQGYLDAACMIAGSSVAPEAYSAPYVVDQVVLLFRHRHNLLVGEDGGQVLLFTRDPAVATARDAYLIEPMPALANPYRPAVRSLGGPGFTGHSGWNTTSFDLTPWAGKTVWIAFRVATSLRADSDPAYFGPASFPQAEPFGWVIDDVEVIAHSYGRNLKLYSLEGPRFRLSPDDPYDRIPPGQELNVTSTVLNAGAGRTTARVLLYQDGAVLREYTKEMEAGEVWQFQTPVTAPGEDGRATEVKARVFSPAPNGVNVTSDLKPGDDERARTFLASAFSAYSVSMSTSSSIVDDGQPQVATARVENTGNVPIEITLQMWESYNATNTTTGARDIPQSVTYPDETFTLSVGESKAVSWPVTTSARGPHVLHLNATGADIEQTQTVTYYVHASPEPAFAAGLGEPVPEGWNSYITRFPQDPVNDWAWVARGGGNPNKVLVASPMPGVAENGTYFTDLKLQVRYFAPYSARISITYPSPAAFAPIQSPYDFGAREVWATQLPVVEDALSILSNYTWTTYEVDVRPNESEGYYAGLWSLNGLEVRVRTIKNYLLFYLDELALTGVPEGGDESDRIALIRITGNETTDSPIREALVTGNATVNSTYDQADSATDDTPAEGPVESVPEGSRHLCKTSSSNQKPEACEDEYLSTGTVRPGQPAACQGSGAEGNCWRRVSAWDLARDTMGSLWQSTNVAMDGKQAIFRYFTDDHVRGDFDRLVTPVIDLRGATDPLVFLDHSYAFQGSARDTPPTLYQYAIHHLAFPEVQYLRDDGTWSNFIRLEPVGGYRTPFAQTEGDAISRTAVLPRAMPSPIYQDHFGFYHPSGCRPGQISGLCDDGGYTQDASFGKRVWRQYSPTPYPEVSIFRIKDFLPHVNLTERPIRLGFHVMDMLDSGPSFMPSQWNLFGIRVTPVSRFAIDATISNVTLETTYDWKKLGVAPGSIVPVNATVQNVGLFTEDWSLRLGVSRPGEAPEFGDYVRIGSLPPGESSSVVIPWNVSAERENAAYVLTVEVAPTDNRTRDENRFNDRFVVGGDGTLVARTVRDAAVTLQAFPLQGDVGVTRYLPITLYNFGNVPLQDVSVVRRIEFFTSTTTESKDRATFEVTRPVPPDGQGVSLTLVAGGVRDADLAYVPDAYGTYLVSIGIEKDGVPMTGDAEPGNNLARAFLEASEPLYSEGFDTRLRWYTDEPDLWGDGPGFRSAGALTAANRSTGLIPPNTDASVVSVSLPTANARTAVVNFVHRYDLEKGYDGGVVEVSEDNRTWHRVYPLDGLGRTIPYPSIVTASNPLAADAPPDQNVTAFSGDSSTLPGAIEGWAPASFDLASVPALSETVVFKSLAAPEPIPEDPIRPVSDRIPDERIASASWLSENPSDAAARWEIRNEAYSKTPQADRFWSGKVQGSITSKQMSRTWDNATSPEGTALVVTWWDRRPGTHNSDWRGIGAEYVFRVTSPALPGHNYADPSKLEVIGRDGSWYRIRAVLDASLPRDRPVTLAFDMQRTSATVVAPDTGWEVRGITFAAVSASNGIPIPGAAPVTIFTGDETTEEERNRWTRTPAGSWQWVNERAPSKAPWNVVVAPDEQGRLRPQWNLTLNAQTRANVDARLVSPVVDLAGVGGGKTLLRLVHKFDLVWDERSQPRGAKPADSRYYQGGTVEIEVYNRSTLSWDPPRQIFADPVGPTRDLIGRVEPSGYVTDAAPYSKTLADGGDTFDRFPRRHLQAMANNVYYRYFNLPLSYVYSGSSTQVSGNQDGWLTHEFDLSAYRGERVRLVFHAWTGPNWAATSGVESMNTPRFWAISQADIVGNVLSTGDVWLRFRLGTDASGLAGSWAIDQFEVSGRKYTSSVGIHLDEQPETVSSEGVVTVSGILQNYGRGLRDGIGVGIQFTPQDGSSLVPFVVPIETPRLTQPTGFDAAAGPFALQPAGEPGSIQPFRFQIAGIPGGGVYRVRLVVLDAQEAMGGLAFGPARDDVPGRAQRQWVFSIENSWSARIDSITTTPAHLGASADVRAIVKVANAGTHDLHEITGSFVWVNIDNSSSSLQTDYVPDLEEDPLVLRTGETITLVSPPFRPSTPGNYSVRVQILNASRPFEPALAQSATVRVARGDVIHAATFDASSEDWESVILCGSRGFRTVDDEAAFGNRSFLFGVTNAEYDAGQRIHHYGCANGLPRARLVSPILDLRGAGPNPVLTFWKKSLFKEDSVVSVHGQVFDRDGGTHPDCPRESPLWPEPNVTLGGRDTDWVQVRVPLVGTPECPLSTGYIRVWFDVLNAIDQGWRVDGVTVSAGELGIAPLERTHDLSDGLRKTYLFEIENRGLAPKDLSFAVESNLSRISTEQAKWVQITPERAVVPPGGKSRITVALDVPSARGLFSQPLNVTLGLREKDKPYVLNTTRLNLDFEPKPRADLTAAAAIDGKPLGLARVSIEEGTPHEVGVLVSNIGTEASRPAQVILRIVNGSGGVLWEHQEVIEGLLPVGEGGEAVLVAASWKPPFGQRGNVTLLVSVDPDRLQIDLDRANGELALPLAITPLIRPDLVVDARSLRISTPDGTRLHEAVPGQLVRISGLVRNGGLADARQVTIRIIAGSSVLKEEVIPLLKAGDGYVASTNQIAPPTTTTYQIVALTPDVEIRPDNNAQLLEMPILPPELVLGAPGGSEIRVEPGERREVALDITNTAPYPTLVNLSLGAGVRFATLSTARLALGPGETRNFTLLIEPSARQVAGEDVATVLVESSEGVRTRKTLDVSVTPIPAASALAYLARGPPQDVRIEIDAVNTGNVELRPHAVVRDEAGAELLRHELPAVPPGASRFTVLSLRLPATTPPGPVPLHVDLEADGARLSRTPVQAQVEPWGRIHTRVDPGAATGGVRTVGLALTYEGNTPTVRQPVLINTPPGVVARYSEESITLAPGETRNLSLRIATPRQAPEGLWLLQAGFLDPATGAMTLLGNLTSIPLDLRQARVELTSARRVSAEAPSSGASVDYVAKIRNTGDRAAEGVPVDLYVDGALVDRQLVEGLAPGETREVRLTYVADAGRHAIVLAVDPHGPHADRSPAFAETLDVASGPIDGVPGLQEVPAPSALVLMMALVLLAGIRRRGRSR